MKRWIAAVLAVLVLGILAGCTEDENSADRRALLNSVSGLMTGWRTENVAYLEEFISADYAFDEQNKADHIAAIVADFPDLRSFRVVRENVQIIDPNLASVQVEFVAELYADVASLDQLSSIFAWVRSDNVLDQVWIKDFDGVWRLAAEYLKASWVLDDTPVITDFSVAPGDQIAPGTSGSFSAAAVAASSAYRVTLWPTCDAASMFSPDYAFGFRTAEYFGDITIRADAFGEYSFSMIGQTDLPGQARMYGRRLRAVYIVVSDRAGRAIIGGKVVPGNKRSVFRHLRIRRAAGQYKEPRPGTAP